ncbi:hypothetical protein AX16_004134 [Volvariella volvacea WC 439]|nr:hypothetical protein AX16_004134 [Volvariella volvacea WC 439]
MTKSFIEFKVGTPCLHPSHRPDTSLKVTLRRYSNGMAMYDSGLFDSMECHQETRIEEKRRIAEWAETRTGSERVLALEGGIGHGKTALCQYAARELKSKGRLGGTYFFHPQYTLSPDDFVNVPATLAYGLSMNFPPFIGSIDKCLLGYSSAAHSCDSFRARWDRLLLRPLETLMQQQPSLADHGRYLMIIDGIDAYDSEKGWSVLLDCIHSICKTGAPILWLLSFRRECLNSVISCHELSTQNLISPNPVGLMWTETVAKETTAYIKDYLHRATLSMPPNSPPLTLSEESLEDLVQWATGQFTYLVRAMAYIARPNKDPNVRWKKLRHNRKTQQKVMADLNAFYCSAAKAIFKRAGKLESISRLVLLHFRQNGNEPSTPASIADFWRIDRAKVELAVNPLRGAFLWTEGECVYLSCMSIVDWMSTKAWVWGIHRYDNLSEWMDRRDILNLADKVVAITTRVFGKGNQGDANAL